MWRVAIYARQVPGRAGRGALDRQTRRLRTEVSQRPEWRHVANYVDQCPVGRGPRPGLSRLLVEAPAYFDLLVVDGYGQLSSNRRVLSVILGQLAAAGVTTVALAPSTGRRLARAVANFALADMIGEALD
jgi:DNA invertase Pin-like site-specific DNA recombinase